MSKIAGTEVKIGENVSVVIDGDWKQMRFSGPTIEGQVSYVGPIKNHEGKFLVLDTGRAIISLRHIKEIIHLPPIPAESSPLFAKVTAKGRY